MNGDAYRRRETSPGVYQCGCRWERRRLVGDVLVECAIHKRATSASVDRVDRKLPAPSADASGEENPTR